MSGIRERMNLLRGRPSSEPQPVADDAVREALRPGPEEPAPDGSSHGPNGEEIAEPAPGWIGMNVRTHSNEWGDFLLRRIEYGLEHRHGDHRLAELIEAAPALSAFHPAQADRPAAERLLFLDLETTGLGVGTGNVPFMTGLGYAEEDRFVIEQALIRHPAEERAMLRHVLGKLGERPYLVTYNGRTFDWPLLAGRYIMNGMGRMGADPLHLDFLHPSRSIWRNTLTSCRLSHVEEERLGINRKDDVPGSLAPSIYFQFLADGRPEPLAGVFRHNEDDMLALACLAIRFGLLLGGALGGPRLPYPTEPEELLRTGLWLDRMGEAAEAEALFERLSGLEPDASWCMPLAARDKKCGNWERAVLLWQKAARASERSPLGSGEAHIELAIYYEHRAKDYGTALLHAERAMELALARTGLYRNDPKRRAAADAIRKRTERLKKKAGRKTI